MKNLQTKVQLFIQGKLSVKDAKILTSTFLTKKMWRDYLITELTAHYIKHSKRNELRYMLKSFASGETDLISHFTKN